MGVNDVVIKIISQNLSKQGFQDAARDVGALGDRLSSAGERLSSFGSAMAPISLAVGAFGVLAAGSFLKFEENMNRVGAVTGAVGEEFAGLESLAQELGRTTAFSAREAADAMGFLAMAGFEVQEISGALPSVLQLASAAQLDLAEAADITTNILTGYGLQVEDLGRANDALVTAFTSANTNLSQLGQAFKFAGPVARSAGVGFTEAGAALALMGNAGIQATMAGTGLRGAIVRLLNPTKSVSDELHRLGIVTKDSTGKLLPLDQIIQQLEPHAEDAGAIMAIFGQRAGPAMAALVGQGSDALRELTAKMDDAGGTAERIEQRQLAGLTGAWIKFKSALEGAFIEVGERMAPALEQLAEVGTAVLQVFQEELLPAFDQLPASVQLATFGLGVFTTTVAPLAIGSSAILRVLGPLMGGVGTAAAGAAPKVGLLRVAMTGLGAGLKIVGPAALAVGAAFGAWKLGRWIVDVTDLDDALAFTAAGFWDVDEAVTANKRAALLTSLEWESMAEGLGTTTTVAERFAAELEHVEAAVIDGRIGAADLDAMMRRLQDSGHLTTEAMETLASAAIVLDAEGQELTTGLQRMVEWMEAGSTAGGALEAQQAAAAAAAVAHAEAVSALADDLSDAGLAGDVALLEAAWRTLTPAEQENELVLLRVAAAVDDVTLRGGELSEELKNVAANAFLASQQGLIPLSSGLKLVTLDARDATDRMQDLNLAFLTSGQGIIPLNREVGDLGLVVSDTLVPSMEDLEGLLGRQGGLFDGVRDSIQSLMKGLTGGNGLTGFMSNLGKGMIDGFGAIISGGISSVIGIGVNLAIKGLGKLGSAIKGLFGRSTADNIALTVERQWGAAISDGLAKSLGTMGDSIGDDMVALLSNLKPIFDDVGGVMEFGFQRGARAARDLFSMIDRGRIDAGGALQALLPPLEALAAEFDTAGGAGQAQFIELIQLAAGFGLDMGAIADVIGQDLVDRALNTDLATATKDAGDNFTAWTGIAVAETNQLATSILNMRDELGTLTDAGLDPFMAQLIDLGVITDADVLALNSLGQSTLVDFQAMESAAKTYGIELSQLGSEFDTARISAAATSILDDFTLLTDSGASVGVVIAGMGDEINALVGDAQQAGVQIPAEFQPVIQEMIKMGTLIGADGQAITDMSQIDFASPIVSKFDQVVDRLGLLINEFLRAMGIESDFGTEGVRAAGEVGLALNGTEQQVSAFDTGLRESMQVMGFWEGTGVNAGTAIIAENVRLEQSTRDVDAALGAVDWASFKAIGVDAGLGAGGALTTTSQAALEVDHQLGAVDWAGFAAAAVDASVLALDAVNAVSFGSSPGGIKEIPIQLALARLASDDFERDLVGDFGRVRFAVDGVSDGLGLAGIASRFFADGMEGDLARVRRELAATSSGVGTLTGKIGGALSKLRQMIAASDAALLALGLDGADFQRAAGDAEKDIKRDLGESTVGDGLREFKLGGMVPGTGPVVARVHGGEVITPRSGVEGLAGQIASALAGVVGGGDVYVLVDRDGRGQRLSRQQFRQIEAAMGSGVIRVPSRAIGEVVS